MPRSLPKPIVPLVAAILRWRNKSTMNSFAEVSVDTKRLVSVHRDALRFMKECEDPQLQAIEEHRQRLSQRDEPLVDGSLDEGAPWDQGASIAKVVNDSRSPRHARYLYGLIRCTKPRQVLELGTNIGVSGAYIAAALKANDEGGKLFTMDRSSYRQRLAKSLFDEAGLGNVKLVLGDFSDTFDLTIASEDPFDFAFIDGNHQLEPTLHYADAICQRADGPIDVVFDDIRWSDGMTEAWQQLSKDSRMAAGLDLHNISLCTMNQRSHGQPLVSPPLRAEFI